MDDDGSTVPVMLTAGMLPKVSINRAANARTCVRMDQCMHACMHACVHANACMHAWIQRHASCVCMHSYIHTCMCMCMCMCMYVHVCTCAYMYLRDMEAEPPGRTPGDPGVPSP